MADTPRKPRAIMLVDFQEDILASGRKLLHGTFKDRYSDWTYRWTAPWQDTARERGVERLFFRAIEVEEWNDPKGAWDEELKKAAEEIPALREFQLPVQVKCSGLAMTTVTDEKWAYKFRVTIVGDGDSRMDHSARCDSFSIGDCEIRYSQFKDDFLAQAGGKWGLGISEKLEGIWNRDEDGDYLDCVGVPFNVWLPRGLARQDYRIVGREVAS